MRKTMAGWMLVAGALAGLSAVAQSPRLLVRSDSAKGAPPLRIREEADGEPQVKDDLLAGTEKFAQGSKESTEVNLDRNMLGMIGKDKEKDKADLAGKMDFVVVHSYTYDKPGMYRQQDVDEFRKRLQDGSWNCFIHVKQTDGATDICTRSNDHGESHDLVVMTSEPKQVTFVHLRGRMSVDDLEKMQPGGGGLKKH